MDRDVMRRELQEMSGSLKFADATLRVVDQAIVEGKLPAWDPKYLFCAEPDWSLQMNGYRLGPDGRWEYSHWAAPGQWEDIGGSDHPIYRELARRLLEERKQQEALDEHNDKMEAGGCLSDPDLGAYVSHCAEEASILFDELRAAMRKIELRLDSSGDHDSVEGAHDRIQLHDQRLTALELENQGQVEENERVARRLDLLEQNARVDGETLSIHLGKIEKLEQDLLLVQGQAAHVDEREAGDFEEATRIRLDKLRDLKDWRSAVYDLADVDAGARIRSLEDKEAGVMACLDQLHTRISQLEGRPLQAMEADLPEQAADLDGAEEPVVILLKGHPDIMLDVSLKGFSARLSEAVARSYAVDDSPDYEKLLAVWKLWGPEGELRKVLTYTSLDTNLFGQTIREHTYFKRLRSELLALPAEVKL